MNYKARRSINYPFVENDESVFTRLVPFVSNKVLRAG